MDRIDPRVFWYLDWIKLITQLLCHRITPSTHDMKTDTASVVFTIGL